MSYLLCYASKYMNSKDRIAEEDMTASDGRLIVRGSRIQRTDPGVRTEEYENFKDAIAQYTFRCLLHDQVTLSKINDIDNSGQILRQYSCKPSSERVSVC